MADDRGVAASVAVLRIRTRNQAAAIHRNTTVSQPTSEVLSAKGLVAPGTIEGTMSLVLLTAACISMTSSRLPWVRQYSHAAATESAVTCRRYNGNDCPDLSIPGTKNRGR